MSELNRKIFRLWLPLMIASVSFSNVSNAQEIFNEKIFVHTDKNYYHTGEIIWFKIFNVDSKKLTASNLSKLAYAEILDSSNRQVIQGKTKIDKGAGDGSFTIPSSASTGIYTFRCYTNWMKNFGPDAFFEKEIVIINAVNGKKSYINATKNDREQNAGSLIFNVETDKQQYRKRQKVILTVSTVDSLNKFITADLSISVYRLDSLITKDPSNIYNSLNENKNIKEPEQFSYPPEYNGHFVNGRMISRNTRMPSSNITGYLTVMDDANSFYNSNTNAEGRIRFLVSKLNSADSIVVQTHSYYDRDQQIEIESPFSNQFTGHKDPSFVVTDSYPETVLEQSINAQVNQLYYETQRNSFRIIKKDSIPFYYKEDSRYTLDNYTRFSRMEDVFREYIRPVGVTKKQGKFHLTVFNESNRFLSDIEPLVLVDAVPVFDINTLFTYDPLKVKTIDVVTDKYFRSGAMFPGIISLTTFRGRTDGQMIDPNASVLGYEIVQKQRQFYSLSYDTALNTHMPDFRTTLYWNPSVHTDANGKTVIEFYTSELEGEYVISIQGISANGKCGSVWRNFSVK